MCVCAWDQIAYRFFVCPIDDKQFEETYSHFFLYFLDKDEGKIEEEKNGASQFCGEKKKEKNRVDVNKYVCLCEW